MKVQKKLPETPEKWLQEIVEAYKDAREAITFGSAAGAEITEHNLFHLAPLVCLKFRGIKQSKRLQQRATDAALSSYVGNKDSRSEVMRSPIMAFSLCYVASHYGLNLIDEGGCPLNASTSYM